MYFDFEDDDDLMFNASARLPVCIVIDTSNSMKKIVSGKTKKTGKVVYRDGKYYELVEGGVSLLDEVVDGVNKFYKAILQNEQARRSCEICIVKFDDCAKVLEEFSSIERKNRFYLPDVGNNTTLCDGIDLALDTLEKRKNVYKDMGIEYYQPWLVLFTDGNTTESPTRVRNVQERCKKLIEQNKLTVMPFALDDSVNLSILQGFSKMKPIKLRQNNADLDKLFTWLGKSVGVVTKNMLGGEIKIDDDLFKNWGDV